MYLLLVILGYSTVAYIKPGLEMPKNTEWPKQLKILL